MDQYYDGLMLAEREPTIAITHWEAKWFAAGSVFDPVFDPAYDRATAALRRWLDGMEAALQTRRCRGTEANAHATNPGQR